MYIYIYILIGIHINVNTYEHQRGGSGVKKSQICMMLFMNDP